MNRFHTNVRGLDEVLSGGLPIGSTTILAGAPGTGKTILAQQILFATPPDERGLYISTLSEPQVKVLGFLQHQSYFQPQRFMDSIVYQDVGSHLISSGPDAVLNAIIELVGEHRPALLVIDSYKAILDSFEREQQRREFTYRLTIRLAVWGTTAVLVGEYSEQEVGLRPEFAVVDGIILLYGTEERRSQRRYLRVLKMRATDLAAGEHAANISNDGFAVFPRHNPRVADQSYVHPWEEPERTGVVGLDEMLRGGLPASSVTLLRGPGGSGKSLLSCNWLAAGASAGQPGMLVTYDSPPHMILRGASAIGLELEPLLRDQGLIILHASPLYAGFDEHMDKVMELSTVRGIRRIVIDSTTAMQAGLTNVERFTSHLWTLVDWCRFRGISLMMISETTPGTRPLDLPSASFLVDNILELSSVREPGRVDRKVRVVKARCLGHELESRGYRITSHGIDVEAVPQGPGTRS